jgi:hypothetical protein
MNISIAFRFSGFDLMPLSSLSFCGAGDSWYPNRLWNASYVVRRRLAVKFGSIKGCLAAKRDSSHGRSNFISDVERRQGKLVKKQKPQSRRLIMFTVLLEGTLMLVLEWLD